VIKMQPPVVLVCPSVRPSALYALAALNLELKDRGRRRCCSYLMYERERPVGAQPSMVCRSRAKHLACCARRFIRLSASHLHNLHL
jgi:hypothetical protein